MRSSLFFCYSLQVGVDMLKVDIITLMTIHQIADRWVELVRSYQDEQAMRELYSPNIESVENGAQSGEKKLEVKRGFEGKAEKNKMWDEMVAEVHEIKVSDPVVGDRGFACSIYMDVTYRDEKWGRQQMTELCMLEVVDGKIIREEYIY